MSNKTTLALIGMALLAGGAVAWQMHNRRDVSRAAAAAAVTAPQPAAMPEEPKDRATAEPSEAARPSPDAARQPVDKKKAAAVAEAASPLRTGETWQYSANVSKLSNVANLLLKVAEKRNFLGKNAWHLQAFAHTENPLRMMFALDDQFDSYSDAGTLVSMQYEMHLNEKGQTVDSVQRMSPAVREPAPADATAARVLPGTRDPLGMMQYLRTVDWTKTPEVRSPVYDGHKLYDVHARLEARGEAVTVPAGNFNTLKIELRVLDNGAEMKDAHFILYLSNTDARLPVLLEAVMPFATARVELVKAE
jgi:Protein of unknown function (DUF3108)